jgi:hypothetical protein
MFPAGAAGSYGLLFRHRAEVVVRVNLPMTAEAEVLKIRQPFLPLPHIGQVVNVLRPEVSAPLADTAGPERDKTLQSFPALSGFRRRSHHRSTRRGSLVPPHCWKTSGGVAAAP